MFVVYHYSYPNFKPRYFETERGAKIARGRNNKDPKKMACGILTLAAFNSSFADKKVQVKNLMTGEMVEIPHDTPRSCDPSSELYWSM